MDGCGPCRCSERPFCRFVESASRTQCASRLRQVAQGLQFYEATNRASPYGVNNDHDTVKFRRETWVQQTLPFVEQMAIYDKYMTSQRLSGQLFRMCLGRIHSDLQFHGQSGPQRHLLHRQQHACRQDSRRAQQNAAPVGSENPRFGGWGADGPRGFRRFLG